MEVHACDKLPAGFDIQKEQRLWQLRMYRVKSEHLLKGFKKEDWREHFLETPVAKITISYCPYCGELLGDFREILRKKS